MLYTFEQECFMCRFLEYDGQGNAHLKKNVIISKRNIKKLLAFDEGYFEINDEHLFPEWESLQRKLKGVK